jgi:hypothetical protein
MTRAGCSQCKHPLHRELGTNFPRFGRAALRRFPAQPPRAVSKRRARLQFANSKWPAVLQPEKGKKGLGRLQRARDGRAKGKGTA